MQTLRERFCVTHVHSVSALEAYPLCLKELVDRDVLLPDPGPPVFPLPTSRALVKWIALTPTLGVLSVVVTRSM